MTTISITINTDDTAVAQAVGNALNSTPTADTTVVDEAPSTEPTAVEPEAPAPEPQADPSTTAVPEPVAPDATVEPPAEPTAEAQPTA